ncbi:MAG TPA: adenylate/guanylate cyclase domain-containing protein [Pyrinomonadaceae bacterium]|nr:adenylate/guanylate cyclase domain-containing protein [Pyrinomonadaceae bacterium]
MALISITDAGGRQWQVTLDGSSVCTIGRAPDNTVVLNDPRASRYHAHVKFQSGAFVIVDGRDGGGRSANHVFVNGQQRLEHPLSDGDQILVGASRLRFEQSAEQRRQAQVAYDDRPLGHTQLLVSASDIIKSALEAKTGATTAPRARDARTGELGELRRKAKILALLYEMSKTLGSEFDLDAIFAKATEVIFDATPADRVVALLADEDGGAAELAELRVVSMRVKDERREAQARRQTIGRTITRKVMRERQALLSQDAASDQEFAGVHSIVSQGVRSTICAPLVGESRVHGALYADRLDSVASFTRDDLELISAVAAQAAVAVENARAHERLAREEVARANYGRFLPEYVVQQILEDPDSFKLGGVNQTLTVLFADIRGFTSLSETAQPEKVVQLLNRYFTAMSDIIFAHGGTLDKYIGDGLMALFGAPTVSPEDACNAVAAAVQMQRQMEEINEDLVRDGFEPIHIGIGLHTGVATVGYIGSERRSEYTAIGDTVNLASRLEAVAQPGQILLSEATAAAAANAGCTFRPRPAIMVKNRVQPVPLFDVDWHEAGAATGDR